MGSTQQSFHAELIEGEEMSACREDIQHRNQSNALGKVQQQCVAHKSHLDRGQRLVIPTEVDLRSQLGTEMNMTFALHSQMKTQ